MTCDQNHACFLWIAKKIWVILFLHFVLWCDSDVYLFVSLSWDQADGPPLHCGRCLFVIHPKNYIRCRPGVVLSSIFIQIIYLFHLYREKGYHCQSCVQGDIHKYPINFLMHTSITIDSFPWALWWKKFALEPTVIFHWCNNQSGSKQSNVIRYVLIH